MEVFCVDPGVSIGIAYLRELTLYTDVLKTYTDLHLYLQHIGPSGVIVCESFNSGNVSHGPMLRTVKVIGAIEAFSELHHLLLVQQTPSSRTAFLDDATLLLKPHKVLAHHIDACAHLLRYLHSTVGSYQHLSLEVLVGLHNLSR